MSSNIHNPISTVTNFAYILLGYIALPFYLGWFLIGLGIASTGFHWTRSDAWHKADIVAIYYIFAVIGGHLLFGNIGTLIGLVIGAIAHWSFKSHSGYSTIIIGSLGLLALGADCYASGLSEMLVALGWFLCALAFGEGTGYLNLKEDSVQYDVLHGVWHILSAMGIWELIR